MRRKLIRYTGFLLSVVFLCPHFAMSQEDSLIVDDSAFANHTRPKVVFPHQRHTEINHVTDCNVCHHVYEGGVWVKEADSIGMECSQCHYQGKKDTILDLIRVYHLQCKGCHMSKKAGPVLCGQCHSKE
jgi:hypothetical protein